MLLRHLPLLVLEQRLILLPLRFRRELLQALLQRLRGGLQLVDQHAVDQPGILVGRGGQQCPTVLDWRQFINARQLVQPGLTSDGTSDLFHLHGIQIPARVRPELFQVRHRLPEEWVVPAGQLLLLGQHPLLRRRQRLLPALGGGAYAIDAARAPWAYQSK
ncbi:hypothetical protein XavaCFBP5823_00625 [Xanthomonas axonopodis pv. vasculorum]|nr:hypothetical protein XavaCFBP5823_00625 [Xanthomonas axonopodis pv. vasculorum]